MILKTYEARYYVDSLAI